MMTMTTAMPTRSPLGRAHDASMSASAAYVSTTPRTATTDVVTNPWLGGFGFGDGAGICPTTVVEGSTKRIHPGRPEGMT